MTNMVDRLTNGANNSYTRFAPTNTHNNGTLVTLATLRQNLRDQKYKKQLSRQANLKVKDEQLFYLKENVPNLIVNRKRPLMGLCCQTCTFSSRECFIKKTTEDKCLINILNNSNEVFDVKRYVYPEVAERVLKEDRVRKAIKNATLQQIDDSETCSDGLYEKILKMNENRARKILYNMRSKLSNVMLSVSSWLLKKVLPCFLSSIVVHPGQVQMIEEASKSNLPLIFLPLHRSHLDYILISFILFNNNVRCPLVAAGDNLRIPLFESLLRGLGAFYIKRQIDPVMGRKDYVYKAVLYAYINLCLKAGHNMELFLEGGRSQTGKPCMPKYGVLSVIVESFLDGTIEDALIVPVSINYEKLVDGDFIKSQLGGPKQKETFKDTLKGVWRVLHGNYGMIRIDFNQPFSLRELTKAFDMNQSSSVVCDEHKSVVEFVSKHVIFDCGKSTAVLCTNAVAFLLLTRFREEATVEDLARALEDLTNEFVYSGKDVGYSGNAVDVVNYALHLLGPTLIKRTQSQNQELITPVCELSNLLALSYYSNMLVNHFSLESAVALALSVTKTRMDMVSHNDLLENTLEVCDILQFEFIFCKPCQSLGEIVTSTIDDFLVKREIFETNENSDLALRSRKIAAQFDDEDEVVFEKWYKLNTSNKSLNYLKHLQNILIPLMESYAVTALALDTLIQGQLLENELVSDVLIELKNHLNQGLIQFPESVAVSPIKNALKLFEKWGVLELYNENNIRLYSLNEKYNNIGALQELYGRINKYKYALIK